MQILERGVFALESIAKAIENSNQTELWLVIISLITAISSIVFGIISLKKSENQIKKSWEKQEAEHFERVRPWIVIKTPIPFQVEYDKSTESYEVHIKRSYEEQIQAKTITIAFLYSVKGQRVANNLKRLHHNAFQPFTKEEFVKMEETPLHMSLAPEQEQSFLLHIPYSDWVQLKTQPVFLGIQLSYDNGKDRSVSGGLYKLSNIGFELLSIWYT